MTRRIRGRVFLRGRGTWVYEVTLDGHVVLTDNTGSWRVVYDACLRDIEAVARLTSAGHLLQTWADIMDFERPSAIGEADGLIWYSPAHRVRQDDGRYGWYLAGRRISDLDAALLVASGESVQRDVALLMVDDVAVTDLVAAVSAAQTNPRPGLDAHELLAV